MLSIFYRLIVAVGIIAMITSCASTKLITEYDAADAFPLSKDTTVWHFFWGLKQAAPIRPQCDPTFNYLSQVQVRTTPGQVLLSFLTLGIVLPQRLSWSCGVYNPEPGTPGQPRNNNSNEEPGSPGAPANPTPSDSTQLRQIH